MNGCCNRPESETKCLLATGEQIKISAKRVAKFRLAKAAKDAIWGTK